MNYTPLTQDDLQKVLAENPDDLSGYEFTEVNWTEIPLKGLVLAECKFTNCNLSNVSVMNVTIRDVLFENCNLMGINWTDAKKGANFDAIGCKMDYGCFQTLDLRGRKLENCSIREADFAEANLSQANLRGSQFSGTTFRNVNFEKADLRHARNYFIDPKFAKLKEAKFSFPDALVLIEALGAEVEM